MTTLRSTVPIDLLRDDLRGRPALPALSGERYARTHAAFEAASDQRTLLQAWVAETLPPLLPGSDPVRIVGVGVGDGSVDAPLATVLAAQGRRVHYTGIEPHPASAVGFALRLAALEQPTLTPTVVVGPFTAHDQGRPVDLVHFLHALYYVPDLRATIEASLDMLRPGGLLVTAVAPLEPLCVLTEALSPWAELRPWFAADVHSELSGRGLELRTETLVAHLDVREVLADPLGRGAAILDFLIGADSSALSDAALGHVLDHLRAIAPPDRPGTVPHPLELVIARA